jgi:hypothetical protein
MKRAGFFILVLMMIAGPLAFADHDETRNNILAIIDEVVPVYGPPKNPEKIGEVFEMKEGEYIEFERTLYGGVGYYIIGAGDSRAREVILAVFDENWNLVGKDIRPSPKAVVEIKPEATGPFYFRLVLKESKSARASIGYVIIWGEVR